MENTETTLQFLLDEVERCGGGGKWRPAGDELEMPSWAHIYNHHGIAKLYYASRTVSLSSAALTLVYAVLVARERLDALTQEMTKEVRHAIQDLNALIQVSEDRNFVQQGFLESCLAVWHETNRLAVPHMESYIEAYSAVKVEYNLALQLWQEYVPSEEN